MNKTKEISFWDSLLPILKILSLMLFPMVFTVVCGYALFLLAINLASFAIDKKIKTEREAKRDLSDRLHQTGISIVDFLKDYALFALGIK